MNAPANPFAALQPVSAPAAAPAVAVVATPEAAPAPAVDSDEELESNVAGLDPRLGAVITMGPAILDALVSRLEESAVRTSERRHADFGKRLDRIIELLPLAKESGAVVHINVDMNADSPVTIKGDAIGEVIDAAKNAKDEVAALC